MAQFWYLCLKHLLCRAHLLRRALQSSRSSAAWGCSLTQQLKPLIFIQECVKYIHVPLTHQWVRIIFSVLYVHMSREQGSLNKSSSDWKVWKVILQKKKKNLSVWPEDNAGALMFQARPAAWAWGVLKAQCIWEALLLCRTLLDFYQKVQFMYFLCSFNNGSSHWREI